MAFRRTGAPAPLLLLLASLALPAAAPLAATLEDVRARGSVRCGVNAELPGFSTANSLGAYRGFDIDLCRAVAAATLADEEAIEPIAVGAAESFEALKANEIDLLSRGTTWTLERNARHGEFAGTSFYDGQGFMVTRRSGIRSALELDGRRICVGRDTSSELNAADFFAVSELRYRPVYFDSEAGAFDAYVRGECEAITSERSTLAAERAGFDEPTTHEVLPESISKEPRGPLVRAGDERWENIVRWTLNCMLNAEELGVSSGNVASESDSALPAVRRLLGADGAAGEALGLAPDWCASIVRRVGNYGEVYERHVGPDTPIGLGRGINALWTDGGLMYAPPVR